MPSTGHTRHLEVLRLETLRNLLLAHRRPQGLPSCVSCLCHPMRTSATTVPIIVRVARPPAEVLQGWSLQDS